MKCSDKCPMEGLKAIGKTCQFMDSRGAEKLCIKADVDGFVIAEARVQKEARAEAAAKKEENLAPAEKPKTEEVVTKSVSPQVVKSRG